ncbi:UNVERIFIED_ORG: hypothetical protein GGE44_002603 [Rhizobium esperanzae]
MTTDGSVQPHGLWPRVRDRESAIYVTRMAGLPTFLLGISYVLNPYLESQIFDLRSGIEILVGALLILTGLRIRGGKLGLLPFSVAMVLLHALGRVLWAWIFVRNGYEPEMTAAFLTMSLMQALTSLLMISGLRGWRWLKNNP